MNPSVVLHAYQAGALVYVVESDGTRFSEPLGPVGDWTRITHFVFESPGSVQRERAGNLRRQRGAVPLWATPVQWSTRPSERRDEYFKCVPDHFEWCGLLRCWLHDQAGLRVRLTVSLDAGQLTLSSFECVNTKMGRAQRVAFTPEALADHVLLHTETGMRDSSEASRALDAVGVYATREDDDRPATIRFVKRGIAPSGDDVGAATDASVLSLEIEREIYLAEVLEPLRGFELPVHQELYPRHAHGRTVLLRQRQPSGETLDDLLSRSWSSWRLDVSVPHADVLTLFQQKVAEPFWRSVDATEAGRPISMVPRLTARGGGSFWRATYVVSERLSSQVGLSDPFDTDGDVNNLVVDPSDDPIKPGKPVGLSPRMLSAGERERLADRGCRIRTCERERHPVERGLSVGRPRSRRPCADGPSDDIDAPARLPFRRDRGRALGRVEADRQACALDLFLRSRPEPTRHAARSRRCSRGTAR
ncbi:MAG: hypothetical protein QM770_04635 [Tepidisphaeraceae bacterium]